MAAPTLSLGTPNQGTTGAVTYVHPSHTSATTGLFLATETNTTAGLSDPTTPSGAVDIALSPRNQGSNITTLTAWWKRPTTSSETDWSVPAAADHQAGIPFKIEGGLASGDPWDVSAGDGQAAGTTGRIFEPSAGSGISITTLVNDSLVVFMICNSADIGTDNYAGAITTAPTGLTSWTIHDQHQTANGNGGGLLVASGIMATAGDVGTLNWTFSTSATFSGIALSFPPSTGTDGTATPAAIALTSTLPAATPKAGQTTAPAVISAPVTLPAATPKAGGNAVPAVITTPVTLPAATGRGHGTTTPSTVAVTISLAATATGGGSATATPATIALTAALPATTESGGGTTAPAVISTTVTLPAAVLSAGATASPAVVPVTITLPAAAASGSGSSTASPAVIACTATLPATTESGGGTGTPATIPLALTFPAATVRGSATATPTAIPVTLNLPAATASGSSGATVTPAAIALLTAVPNPGISAGSTVSPATIALAITLAAALASGQPPDANPVTVTVRDANHTVTVTEAGYTTTARTYGTTTTVTEVGSTGVTARTFGTTTTAREQR